MAVGMKQRDIVLLSTADWDNPFWTNKQHVAVDLARRGHRVFYIDSLGLRRPSANGQDLTRIARRLLKAARAPREVRRNLWVWSPVLLPLHGQPAVRNLNKRLLTVGLNWRLRRLGFRHDLLWTYNPLTTELLDTTAYDQVVYHCVDDIKAQPGMPVAALEAAEQVLTGRATTVFCTAPRLYERCKRINGHTHYFPNVADFAHFAQALAPETDVPDDLAVIRGPRLGFIGAISGYKVDFDLLAHVARAHPEWSLVLIGKVGEGDPGTDVAVLEDLPNVHLLGPRSYQQLPAYLRGIDVALLPSRLNDYTASMFPMKFFEYLAAGKPVVSTDLAALTAFADVCSLASSPEAFEKAVTEALAGRHASFAQRQKVAQEHTYAARMDKMLQCLAGGEAVETPAQVTWSAAVNG